MDFLALLIVAVVFVGIGYIARLTMYEIKKERELRERANIFARLLDLRTFTHRYLQLIDKSLDDANSRLDSLGDETLDLLVRESLRSIKIQMAKQSSRLPMDQYAEMASYVTMTNARLEAQANAYLEVRDSLKKVTADLDAQILTISRVEENRASMTPVAEQAS